MMDYSGTLSDIDSAEAINNSSTASSSYADVQADLTREQWERYKTTFLPEQEKLINLSNSSTLLNEQLGRNTENINQSFDQSQTNESMRMSRYGLSSKNSAQNTTNNNLLKNLTSASVNNETRQAIGELQDKIITGQGTSVQSLANIGAQ